MTGDSGGPADFGADLEHPSSGDELLFECPEKEVEETSALVRRVMEEAPRPAVSLSVPLVADAGIADTWAAAH